MLTRGMAPKVPPAPFDLDTGTSEHYEDAALYDHEYRRRRDDLAFYRRTARAVGGPVLELGCGSGRVLVPLVRDGFRVVGIDRSAPMLRGARGRLLRLPPSARARAALLRADMRRFSLAATFPLIVAPFNALMHLYHPDAMLRCLRCVREHLAPGGRFVFDVVNPNPRMLARDESRRGPRTRFLHPTDGRAYRYSTSHHYDQTRQIAYVRIYYEPLDGGRGRVVRLAHRMFFPRELEVFLRMGGFRMVERLGGFSGEPLDNRALSQVCVAASDGESAFVDEKSVDK